MKIKNIDSVKPHQLTVFPQNNLFYAYTQKKIDAVGNPKYEGIGFDGVFET